MGGTTVYMSKPLGPITSDERPAEHDENALRGRVRSGSDQASSHDR